jgi:hypothetical protein
MEIRIILDMGKTRIIWPICVEEIADIHSAKGLDIAMLRWGNRRCNNHSWGYWQVGRLRVVS